MTHDELTATHKLEPESPKPKPGYREGICIRRGIDRARELTGITNYRASKDAGMNRNWLNNSKYVNNPTARNLELIAEAFGLEVGVFLLMCVDK